MADGEKICFVIAPIGEEKSKIRCRSDKILEYIIKPAATKCGYRAMRADEIPEPGIINIHVIQHIVNDPLVIADLTGRNPNVFYELAIRHAVRKPYVQLIQQGEPLPFDVINVRTIYVSHQDIGIATEARDEIIKQIKSLERDDVIIQSPVSIAVDIANLQRSSNPQDRQLADVGTSVVELRKAFSILEKKLSDQMNIILESNIASRVPGLTLDQLEKLGQLFRKYIGRELTDDEKIPFFKIMFGDQADKMINLIIPNSKDSLDNTRQ